MSLCVVIIEMIMMLLHGAAALCPSEEVYGKEGMEIFHLPDRFSFLNQRRRFTVYVPKRYNPSIPAPVVLLLHGSGGNEEGILKSTGFRELSEEEGFLLVLGEGVTDGWPQRKKESRSWNSGLCCSTPWVYNIDDVGYIKEVLDMVQRRYCTNADEVFVAGHANGGMMAYRLACELSDYIAAVAINAGSLVQRDYRSCLRECTEGNPKQASKCFDNRACSMEKMDSLPEVFPCTMSRHVSVLHVHGELDPRVPYYGGLGQKKLGNATFLPVETLVAQFAKKYSCDPDRTMTFSKINQRKDRTVLCEEHKGCDGARVELCKLPLGGHHIPGGQLPSFCIKGTHHYRAAWCQVMQEKLGPLSQDFHFSDKSWRFFKNISWKLRPGSKEPRSALTRSAGVSARCIPYVTYFLYTLHLLMSIFVSCM